jgi:hypothetical protein
MRKLVKEEGIASVLALVVMGILAIALPVSTKLVQRSQENRSNAAVISEGACKLSDFKYITQGSSVCTGQDKDRFRKCIKGILDESEVCREGCETISEKKVGVGREVNGKVSVYYEYESKCIVSSTNKDGKCGSANGKTVKDDSKANEPKGKELCDFTLKEPFVSYQPWPSVVYEWTCYGSGEGKNDSCSAPISETIASCDDKPEGWKYCGYGRKNNIIIGVCKNGEWMAGVECSNRCMDNPNGEAWCVSDDVTPIPRGNYSCDDKPEGWKYCVDERKIDRCKNGKWIGDYDCINGRCEDNNNGEAWCIEYGGCDNGKFGIGDRKCVGSKIYSCIYFGGGRYEWEVRDTCTGIEKCVKTTNRFFDYYYECEAKAIPKGCDNGRTKLGSFKCVGDKIYSCVLSGGEYKWDLRDTCTGSEKCVKKTNSLGDYYKCEAKAIPKPKVNGNCGYYNNASRSFKPSYSKGLCSSGRSGSVYTKTWSYMRRYKYYYWWCYGSNGGKIVKCRTKTVEY